MIYFYISLSTYLCYLILKYSKSLLHLEKDNYNLKKYKKYITTKQNLLTPELLAIIPIIISFNLNAKITGISVVVFYALLSLYEIAKKDYKYKPKRKSIIISLIITIIYILLLTLFYLDYKDLQDDFLIFDDSKFYYLILIILGYLSNYLIAIVTFIINLFSKKKHKKNKK